MHACTLVIGDVESQMAPLTAEDGWCDSWTIGGRYTGKLMLKPGAEGKVFGDAMPPAEAMFAHALSEEFGSMLAIERPVRPPGDGVDQARLCDVVGLEVPPLAVVVDSVAHEPNAEEQKAWFAECEDEVEARRTMAELMPRWCERLNVLLGAVDPDALITVIDAHY
jgi:hypothetical protein